jgi:hypothetical protein
LESTKPLRKNVHDRRFACALCRVDTSLTQLLWPVAPCTGFQPTPVSSIKAINFRSFNILEIRALVQKKSLSMLVSTDSKQKSLITLPGESQNAWDQCTYPVYCKLKIQAMCGMHLQEDTVHTTFPNLQAHKFNSQASTNPVQHSRHIHLATFSQEILSEILAAAMRRRSEEFHV